MLDVVAGAIARSIFTTKAQLVAKTRLASQIEAPDPDDKNPVLPIHPGVVAYLNSGEQSFFDESKLVIGTGPQKAELRHRYPDAKFLGLIENEKLAAHLAASDLFVFPSRTDTFGVVQLEALACGVPIAAFPVTGPKDVIGNNPIGVLSHDLRAACLAALHVSRDACRAFALNCSWDISARQFIGHLQNVAASGHARNLRYSRVVSEGV